jgi:hypothetical protein
MLMLAFSLSFVEQQMIYPGRVKGRFSPSAIGFDWGREFEKVEKQTHFL